jgi:hypothetical protein
MALRIGDKVGRDEIATLMGKGGIGVWRTVQSESHMRSIYL